MNVCRLTSVTVLFFRIKALVWNVLRDITWPPRDVSRLLPSRSVILIRGRMNVRNVMRGTS